MTAVVRFKCCVSRVCPFFHQRASQPSCLSGNIDPISSNAALCSWCVVVHVSALRRFGLGVAWHRAHSHIIPQCAAGVDLEVRGQVLAADRKPTGEWSLDARVMGYDEGQTLKRP